MNIVKNVEKSGSFRYTDADENGYEYTQTLVTNVPTNSESKILAAVRRRGSLVARGGYQYKCDEVEASHVEATVWEARIHFIRVPPPRKTKPKADKDPTRWPTEIEWDSKTIEVYESSDAKGRPYVNSAGDKLRDTPPKEICHALASLTRYERAYDPTIAIQYANKINASKWYSCPKETAKCLFPRAVLTWIEEAEGYFWKVTYRFEVAPEGWKVKLADFGKRCLVAETFTSSSGAATPTGNKIKVACKDETGQPTSDGEFLDGSGGQLDREKVEAGKICYVPAGEWASRSPYDRRRNEGGFEPCETIDFNGLRLP